MMARFVRPPLLLSLILLGAGATADTGSELVGTVTGGHGPMWAWVDGDADLPLPSTHPVVHQRGTTFVPAALVVEQGTTVDFKNDGPELHDVYSASPLAYFDLGSYPPGQFRSYTFGEAGVARIGCNKHAQMHLDVLVVPNPWFAAVGQGRFAIAGLTPGRHTVRLWGPELAEPLPVATVDVKPGAQASVTFTVR